MSCEPETVERVRAALNREPGVVEVRMLDGVCFTIDGHLCCGIIGADLLIRVGVEACSDLASRPHVAALEVGRRQPPGFVVVSAAGFQTERALKQWIHRAVEYVGTFRRSRRC